MASYATSFSEFYTPSPPHVLFFLFQVAKVLALSSCDLFEEQGQSLIQAGLLGEKGVPHELIPWQSFSFALSLSLATLLHDLVEAAQKTFAGQ